MADTHYEMDEGVGVHPRAVKQAIRNLYVNLGTLDDEFAEMSQMKDGDGTLAAHFQKIVDQYGVAGADAATKLANAKLIYDEMNSTLNNSAALRQMLAKLG